MSQQLSTHILNSNLVEPFQSRFRPCQSTETVLTEVVNDSTSVLILLYLNVTFDPTLSFDQHIKEIPKIAFYHLHNIAKIRSSLLALSWLMQRSKFTPLFHLDWIIVMFCGLVCHMLLLKSLNWFRMLQLRS